MLNEDQRPKNYGNATIDKFPRPSHADWTYLEKYGVKASSGGGRSSARETIGRVAAGAIAEKYLRLAYGIEIVAFVTSVGAVHLFPPLGRAPQPQHQPGVPEPAACCATSTAPPSTSSCPSTAPTTPCRGA